MKIELRSPQKHSADIICFGPDVMVGKHPYNKSVLIRPASKSGFNLRARVVLAWGVFTGKYDALTWFDLPNEIKKDLGI